MFQAAIVCSLVSDRATLKQNPKLFHFPQLARCETCGHEGKLSQSLAIPGDVRHFCNLKCLLHFCHRKLSPSDAGTFRGTTFGRKKLQM